MQRVSSAVLVLLISAIQAFASLQIRPTTTLSAETGNNTSTADSFKGLSNGNAPAGNVSKQAIRSLLYIGATTKIYAHLMPWFGVTELGYKQHVDVGYDSADPAQAERQVVDMVSRGIDGAIIDWYGQFKTHHNTAALNVLYAAEHYANFEVALTEDIGAVSSSSNPTQKTIDDLTYAWTTFMQSPAYMRRNGRPVVFFFGFDGSGIDLAAVKAAVPGNPLFVFRNSGAFSATASDGGFAWLATKTSDYETYMSLPYLDNFYKTAQKYPTQLNFGSGFKGFDDTIASWSPAGGRHIKQFCGQTWLKSMAEASLYYSSSRQLENLQIVTWNDYEEGTALEPGIDSCLGVNVTTSADTLNWSVTGDESTVDHYTVFVSEDGQNLMVLTDVAVGTRALDLKSFDLAAGSYKVFVKAIGKASIRNVMSAAAAYSVSAPPPPPPPQAPADWTISVGPSPTSMARSGSTALSVALRPTSSSYDSSVALACSNLPTNMRCTFSKANVTPGSGASVTLTLAAVSTVSTARSNAWMFMTFGFSAMGMFTMVSARRARWMLLSVLLALSLTAVGCGTGGASTSTKPETQQPTIQPGTYTISVVGTSGSMTKIGTVTVIVQ